MAKLTKSQILGNLAERTGVSKKAAGAFVEELVKLAYKEAKNSFTIPGLGIAIPALIAYMYLRRRIEVLVLELERYTNEVLTRLYRNSN